MSDITVGDVSVDVVPAAQGWLDKLRRQILPDADRLGIEVGRTLSTRINEALGDAHLTVDVDSALADSQLTATEVIADRLDGRKIDMKVDVDKSGLSALSGLTGIGGGAGSGVSSIAVAGAAIVAALPALLALPSLLAAIATPLAVVGLGFEGIKKGASGLSGPLKVLQSVISGVFENELAPVFDDLLKIFPALIIGFRTIAHDLSVVFAQIVGALTSGAGLTALQETFSNIGQAIIVLAPAMGSLTTTFLTLFSSGSAAFASFAPFLADTITKFSQLVTLLDSSGLLAAAFQTMNFLIGALIVVFSALVLSMTLVYAGIDKLATFIGFVLGTAITFISTAISNVGTVVATALGGIETALSDFTTFLSTAWDALWTALEAAASAAWTAITGTVSTGWETVKTTFTSAADAVGKTFSSIWSDIKTVVGTGISDLVTAVAAVPGKLLALVSQFSGAGKSLIQAFISGLSKVGGLASSFADSIWTAVKSVINAGIDALNAKLEFTIPVPGLPDVHVNAPNIGHLAAGTDFWRGGLTIVGERGPELVNLPRGAQVTPNDKLASAAGSAVASTPSLDGATITIVDGGHMANSFQGIVISRSDRMVSR